MCIKQHYVSLFTFLRRRRLDPLHDYVSNEEGDRNGRKLRLGNQSPDNSNIQFQASDSRLTTALDSNPFPSNASDEALRKVDAPPGVATTTMDMYSDKLPCPLATTPDSDSAQPDATLVHGTALSPTASSSGISPTSRQIPATPLRKTKRNLQVSFKEEEKQPLSDLSSTASNNNSSYSEVPSGETPVFRPPTPYPVKEDLDSKENLVLRIVITPVHGPVPPGWVVRPITVAGLNGFCYTKGKIMMQKFSGELEYDELIEKEKESADFPATLRTEKATKKPELLPTLTPQQSPQETNATKDGIQTSVMSTSVSALATAEANKRGESEQPAVEVETDMLTSVTEL